MDRATAAKAGGLSLLSLGAVEVVGGLLALAVGDAAPEIGEALPWEMGFALWLGLVYGAARIAAGYGAMKMKKWGMAAGVVLSVETIIVVPSVFTSGVVGGLAAPLALISLFGLLYSLLGPDTIGP